MGGGTCDGNPLSVAAAGGATGKGVVEAVPHSSQAAMYSAGAGSAARRRQAPDGLESC